jgi:hypothetical protein
VPQNEWCFIGCQTSIVENVCILKYRKTFTVGMQFVERKEDE